MGGVTRLEERTLGRDQILAILSAGNEAPAGGLGFQARHLDRAELQPAHELAALAAGDLAVEADQDRPGLDGVAFAHMDRGHPSAARMVDDLDPAGGLDGTRGMDDLVDLRPGKPPQQGQQECGNAGDQGTRQRRRSTLQALAGELGLAVHIAGGQHRPYPQPVACKLGADGRIRSSTSSAVPVWTTLPSRSRTTRSQACSTAGRWVTTITVRPLAGAADIGEQRRLGRGVQRAGGLVEHEHARVAHDRPGQRDQLALPQRQPEPALAEHGLIALGQAADELVGADEPGGGDDAGAGASAAPSAMFSAIVPANSCTSCGTTPIWAR